MTDEIQRFQSNLPKWQKFLDGFQLPPAIDEQVALSELRQRLGNIRRRLRDGPDAPLRIAFFGPTGAGKSKLFGSLIGNNFSGSGFKRPFTRNSFYYVHNDWKPLVAALHGEVALHDIEKWRNVILIDTPDFDSVETKNRDEAERVFLECDGFLFVTDALKYADASTWEYLDKICAAEKPFAIVLNKVNSSTVPESFRERFDHRHGNTIDYPQVVVPEFRIDDATPIDPDHKSMISLQKTAASLVASDASRQQAMSELLRRDCNNFCCGAESLRQRLIDNRIQVQDARAGLGQRAEAAQRRLDARLTSGLEPAVREDVYQDVLRRLEKIDVLSYPRKLMAMPINGIRSLIGGWLSQPQPETKPEEPAFADPISSETFHLLESEMIAYADQSRNDICRRPGLENLIDRETFKRLRFDHEELQQMYIEHHDAFTAWVANHAEATASQITGENKTKFVLSQVLFNTVLISSQVAIGGAFSFLDLGATGVISPMVAKGISMAIGSEKVKEFEKQAHAEHQRSLSALLNRGRQRFDSFLDEATAGLDELEQTLTEISETRPFIEQIVEQFSRNTSRPQSTPDVQAIDSNTKRPLH